VGGHMGFMAVMVLGADSVAIWARMIQPEPGAPVLCVVTFIVQVPGDWAKAVAPSSSAGRTRRTMVERGVEWYR